MENRLRFIISLFGDRHVGMLLPLLFSLRKSNPEAAISVYWEDIQRETVTTLRQAFPQVEWVETYFNFSTDITQRISSKTLVWNQAAQDKKNATGWLLFLDADMLVRQPVLPFLNTVPSDAILTYREGQFPLNSGVVVFRAGEKTAQFFALWLKQTLTILATPELYAQANDKKLAYGGADQMALHLLLDYTPKKRDYTFSINGQTLTFRTERCEDLNETYSVPLTDRSRILHYKGGWRSLLFENGPFTQNRTKKDSWEMFVYYHKTYQEAITFLNKQTGKHFTPSDFGLTIPFYFDPTNGKEKMGLYRIFWLTWQIQNFFPRLKRYLEDRVPLVKTVLSSKKP